MLWPTSSECLLLSWVKATLDWSNIRFWLGPSILFVWVSRASAPSANSSFDLCWDLFSSSYPFLFLASECIPDFSISEVIREASGENSPSDIGTFLILSSSGYFAASFYSFNSLFILSFASYSSCSLIRYCSLRSLRSCNILISAASISLIGCAAVSYLNFLKMSLDVTP